MSIEKQIEGASGSRDENKISTFTVPYYVESFSEVITVGQDDYHGLIESSRTWQAWNAGNDGYVVTVVYKGHLAEDPQIEDPVKTEQWSMDFDFAEEPLESHPKLAEIKSFYGGYIDENELVFPELMPNKTKSKAGLSQKSLAAGDKNPLFGVKTYAVMNARVSRSWSAKRIPKNAVDDIGKIYNTIPDAPDAIADIDFGDRTWLAMPPKISQNGNVWRIENEWLLSPLAGWVDSIYQKASK